MAKGGGRQFLGAVVLKDVLIEGFPGAHAPQRAPQVDEVPWLLLTKKPVAPKVEGNLETEVPRHPS